MDWQAVGSLRLTGLIFSIPWVYQKLVAQYAQPAPTSLVTPTELTNFKNNKL